MSLKLCPICEEEAIVRTVKDSCNYFVTCKNGCICTQPYETQEEAEREWNERGIQQLGKLAKKVFNWIVRRN